MEHLIPWDLVQKPKMDKRKQTVPVGGQGQHVIETDSCLPSSFVLFALSLPLWEKKLMSSFEKSMIPQQRRKKKKGQWTNLKQSLKTLVLGKPGDRGHWLKNRIWLNPEWDPDSLYGNKVASDKLVCKNHFRCSTKIDNQELGRLSNVELCVTQNRSIYISVIDRLSIHSNTCLLKTY